MDTYDDRWSDGKSVHTLVESERTSHPPRRVGEIAGHGKTWENCIPHRFTITDLHMPNRTRQRKRLETNLNPWGDVSLLSQGAVMYYSQPSRLSKIMVSVRAVMARHWWLLAETKRINFLDNPKQLAIIVSNVCSIVCSQLCQSDLFIIVLVKTINNNPNRCVARSRKLFEKFFVLINKLIIILSLPLFEKNTSINVTLRDNCI